MKTTIEQLEDGSTRIRIPIEFRYDNGRKRIYYPELPDEQLKINVPLATGIARAYRWQDDYRISWDRRVAPDAIVKAEQLEIPRH